MSRRTRAPELDLFSAVQAPYAPVRPPETLEAVAPEPEPAPALEVLQEMLPRRPGAWHQLLRQADLDETITFGVCVLWTGVVVEVLAAGPAGRWFLHHDDIIQQVTPDSGCRSRIIYLQPPIATRMHARRPLLRLSTGGTHGALYRFALPGEPAPAVLPLPAGDADA